MDNNEQPEINTQMPAEVQERIHAIIRTTPRHIRAQFVTAIVAQLIPNLNWFVFSMETIGGAWVDGEMDAAIEQLEIVLKSMKRRSAAIKKQSSALNN